ncbi:hypothetical protein F2Q70_00035749 [Brassica cretica]|uniref:Uncharacterized protein n=1 Tax=Brassica cretica TaxID=69181 RepID=A0A8S9K0F6_BRACR|nr:hypothetical protein F2Q68_00030964 [Brassica cretica]KAF2586896.1 hypothetical protein F2Q70_00035749 [Brassica cretica]
MRGDTWASTCPIACSLAMPEDTYMSTCPSVCLVFMHRDTRASACRFACADRSYSELLISSPPLDNLIEDILRFLLIGRGDGAATTRQESTIVQSNQSGLNPNDLKLDDGNGSVRTLNGEEIEDDGLEHNMDQGYQIFLPTMHNEKSSQARMVVDLFQSEDGRHKSFTAQEEDADQI